MTSRTRLLLLLPLLHAVACTEAPDEGVAVGNPGKADFAIGAPEGIVVDASSLHVSRLLFTGCAGTEGAVVVDRVVDGLAGGDFVNVPAGTWCSAAIEFAGPLVFTGPDADVTLDVPTLSFGLGDGVVVDGDVLRFMLGWDGWMTQGLAGGAAVAPGDDRHEVLVARLRYGARVSDTSNDRLLGEVRTGLAGGYVTVGAGGLRRASPDGVDWRTTDEGGAPLYGVTFGEGTWVAVGGDGAPRVLASSDGVRWNERPVPDTDQVLKNVVWGDGRFVAVGIHGIKLVSPDGWRWEDRSDEWITELIGVTWGADRYVAVGQQDWTVGVSTVSTDGSTWTPVETNGPEELHDVAFGAGRFVAVGLDGLRAASDDGLIWVDQVRDGVPLYAVAYGDDHFVAVGDESPWTSTDGSEWAAATPRMPGAWDVVHGGGGWVAVGEGGKVWTSPDAATWTAVRDDGPALYSVAFGGGGID